MSLFLGVFNISVGVVALMLGILAIVLGGAYVSGPICILLSFANLFLGYVFLQKSTETI